jgi:NAD(P)-dependent dehydrogenase (short-subunit alcohol dehydrogenase family)
LADRSRPTAVEIVHGVDLTGKTCVITGATAGLGRESARALALTGALVVMTGRTDAALAEAESWVKGEVPGALTATVKLDLASLSSVRAAAAELHALAPEIDVLMNNAGVMFTPFSRTADGFEVQLGINHLGHFELTRLLTPQLVAAERARIVILASGGHVMGDIDYADPNWERRDYDKFVAYGASKTANLLHMVELDSQLQGWGVRACSVNPGAVATSLARHMSREDFSSLRKYAAETTAAKGNPTDGLLDFTMPDQGAATQVWAAVGSDLDDVGSVYLEECRISDDVQPYALDPTRASRLWELSERLCSDSVGHT